MMRSKWWSLAAVWTTVFLLYGITLLLEYVNNVILNKLKYIIEMDAQDVFRKICNGTRFDMKRFHRDAERFQLVKGKPNKNSEKVIPEIETVVNKSLKRKHPENVDNGIVDTLTLVDDISVPIDGTHAKQKKKKKIMTEEKILKLEKEKINRIRNINNISVNGNRIPQPLSSFQELQDEYKVNEIILENMKTLGYSKPTPIQMQAIAVLFSKRQLLACAPTGSGKTISFLLPMIHHLGGPQKKGFRALVLSPTTELSKQTYRECVQLSAGLDFRIHTLGKVNRALQLYGPKSSQKFDILITTPKRLLFLLTRDPPAISLGNIEWLIVDEADKLFEDGKRGFKIQMTEILKFCSNPNLVKAMFSATNVPVVTKWCRRNMKTLITITVGQRNAATKMVDQEILYVGNERGKLIAFRNLIQQGLTPPVLVFVNSKERADELFKELIYDGINVDIIHADKTLTQRDNVIRSFREGRIWILICTELMGRGIDFKGVNIVINYDFPQSAISYVHRIGRTGRAGHKGKAITYFTQQDKNYLRSIAVVMRESGCEIPDYMTKV